jgi:hypothetical protein
MSKDIFETEALQVTAFVGPSGHLGGSPLGHCVQFSCKGGHDYAQLTEDEVLELVYALLSRVLCKPGYCATD